MNGISLKQYFAGQYPRNSRVARWDRRFLKGFVNLALILALSGTALAILDLDFSWHVSSESPAEATLGTRHHWGYINMDRIASDSRKDLPKNIEPWGLAAAIKVENPTVEERVLSRLASVPPWLLTVTMIWILRSIVLTTVGTGSSDGDPFIRPNVRRLRILATLLILTPVVGDWSQTVENELFSRSLPKYATVLDFDVFSGFTLMGVGVLVLVMAEVFMIGVRLREDVEGLV